MKHLFISMVFLLCSLNVWPQISHKEYDKNIGGVHEHLENIIRNNEKNTVEMERLLKDLETGMYSGEKIDNITENAYDNSKPYIKNHLKRKRCSEVLRLLNYMYNDNLSWKTTPQKRDSLITCLLKARMVLDYDRNKTTKVIVKSSGNFERFFGVEKGKTDSLLVYQNIWLTEDDLREEINNFEAMLKKRLLTPGTRLNYKKYLELYKNVSEDNIRLSNDCIEAFKHYYFLETADGSESVIKEFVTRMESWETKGKNLFLSLIDRGIKEKNRYNKFKPDIYRIRESNNTLKEETLLKIIEGMYPTEYSYLAITKLANMYISDKKSLDDLWLKTDKYFVPSKPEYPTYEIEEALVKKYSSFKNTINEWQKWSCDITKPFNNDWNSNFDDWLRAIDNSKQTNILVERGDGVIYIPKEKEPQRVTGYIRFLDNNGVALSEEIKDITNVTLNSNKNVFEPKDIKDAYITGDSRYIVFAATPVSIIGRYREDTKANSTGDEFASYQYTPEVVANITSPYHGYAEGQANYDLYYCLKKNGIWSPPINLGNNVNTPYCERSPTFNSDMTKMYFSSDGHPGVGGMDIFEIPIKLNIDNTISISEEPVNITKVNSLKDELFYHPKGDKSYFSSTRGGNNFDIYVFDGCDKKPNHGVAPPVEEPKDSVAKPTQNSNVRRKKDWPYITDLEAKCLPKTGRATVEQDKIEVQGIVYDSEGYPAVNAYVEFKAQGQENVFTETGNDGRFSLIIHDDMTYNFTALINDGTKVEGNSVAIPVCKNPDRMQILDVQLRTKNLKKEPLTLFMPLFFETNVSEQFINNAEEAKGNLQNIIKKVNGYGNIEIILEGYADITDTDAYNLELSTKRVKAAHKFLEDLIQSSIKVTESPKGETEQFNEESAKLKDNKYYESVSLKIKSMKQPARNLQLNRRVQIILKAK